MPSKSVKKIMKELMAKKKLTAKEKKLLIKMQKGGVWWNPLSWGSNGTMPPVDPTSLNKQVDELKDQVCKVCKAAFGEAGCKCGKMDNIEPTPTTENVPAQELNNEQQPSGDGNIEQRREEDGEETRDDSQKQSEIQPQPEKKNGGRRKSSKRKGKRSNRRSKKNM